MRIADIAPDGGIFGRNLLAVQHAAYAVEAKIIEDDRIPPLHETLEELCAERLTWLGAFDDDRLVGAVAWSETALMVDIDRLVVDPGAHRRGIGGALVREVMARAGERRIVVSTGRANMPARTLYERFGFGGAEDVEVIPGLWITRYAYPD
ncbi:Acetyltransferase (GNAT) domain-containing protein [Streptosporangium subroseum]|uniref:Acetyltransferase (GNAT) domain-containing protein n=1 Tax=Streptosporangium subroseum TaxID=106412 RepID=A0A239LKI0_9ACTN|nr:GNAT family N-acetyltransferase [Streptosporangium subroseum]SNT30402.1 Acetyltransferase (GNAT) domain-containing protein [Streptosporangium subroseum]